MTKSPSNYRSIHEKITKVCHIFRVHKTRSVFNFFHVFVGAKILEGTEIMVQEGTILNITCDVYVGRSQNHNLLSTLAPSDPLRDLSLIWLHNNQV